MALVLRDDQEVVLVPTPPTSRGGNPAKIDGAARWSSSNESVMETVPITDQDKADLLSAGVSQGAIDLAIIARTKGPLGDASAIIAVDADLGPGVREVTAAFDLTVVSGEATGGFTISAGVPRDRP